MKVKNPVVPFGMVLALSLTGLMSTEIPARDNEQGQSAAELIKKSPEEEGEEAAREAFFCILKDRARYLFEEQEFLGIGHGHLKSGNPRTAFDHWRDKQALEQAGLACKKTDGNLKKVERWSKNIEME